MPGPIEDMPGYVPSVVHFIVGIDAGILRAIDDPSGGDSPGLQTGVNNG